MSIFGVYSWIILFVQNKGSWSQWPFGASVTGSWLLALSKFVFIGIILAVIILILRFVFGPKGALRDKELDMEAKEEENKKEAMNILRKRLARGDISIEEFEKKKRLLE